MYFLYFWFQDEDHRLSAASMVPPPTFSLPMPYPFSHPAYLPPSSTFSHQNPSVHRTSSEGSHSSESSNSSQQTWSYEEQYKQVRQASKSRSHPPHKLYPLPTLWCLVSHSFNFYWNFSLQFFHINVESTGRTLKCFSFAI